MEEMFFSRRKYTKLLRYAIIAVVCLVAYKFIFPGSPTKITMADVGVSADIHKSDSRPNIPVVRVPDEHVKEGNLEALKAPEQVPIVSQTSQAQSVLDYISQSLDVRLKLLSNLVDGGSTYSFTLTNKGPKPIHSYITDNDGKSSWTIYFCFFHMIQSNPRGFLGANKEFRVSRIDGRVWQLQPTDDFKTLYKGQEVVLPFTAGFSISRYDFYPNWYLTVPELQPRIIQSTHDEALTFVDPLTEPQQWMRSRQDQFKPYSPEERFESNGAIKDLGGHQQPIIPTPFKIRMDTSQEFDFSDLKLWHIVASDAKLLANEIQILKSFTGIEYSDEGEDHRIQLEIGPVNVVDSPPLTSKSEENYKIDMTADTRNIKIVAEKPAGIYYGIRSLLHLIDHQQKMPVTQILDGPRFPYRGLMLDVSRNFFGKRTILELIDTMSMYKLNRLHFHLSDDQGWRLEIPGLPELTEVGARRGHDLKESETLLPYEGSGPFTNSSGSGYFTVSDFREILLHAKNNHIEIIPELDMPGHSHAAIQSMKVRHDRLMAKGLVKEAEEYLISDPQDTSVYEAVGSNRESALNPCRESTYTFVEKVINEVYDIYKVITPMKVLHIGGDEVPWGAYKESPICSKFRKEHPEYTNALDLKFYFIKRVSEIVAKKHLKLQMWEDGVLNSDTDKLADLSGMSVDDLISNSWQNRWEKGEGSRAYRLANRGVKVVLGHATHLYLDHPQEPDPEERGLYWATRYSDSVRIFKYSPESVYDNMDSTLYTKTLDKEEICNNFKDACLPLEKTENIIGMEGALWTELVRTQEQMFSQLFPRAIAMAERAWYKADWEWEKDPHSRERMKNEAWEKFANSLGYRELKRLGKPEYISGRPFMAAQTYYLPPPGVKIVGNEIHVNVCFPGTVVQYYDRDAEQWKDIPGEILQYKGEKLQFRTRGEKQGGVTSRTITIGSG